MLSKNRDDNQIRVRYLFTGIVQGVGFRPFIYRLAVKNGISGFVQNRPEGVLVEAQGPPSAVNAFPDHVRRELPPLAHLTQVSATTMDLRHDIDFRILPSDAQGHADVHIPPDAATCPECLKELFDPDNRRYRYPFINCTNCGPRLTIISAIPYDRANTSMACFPLCPQCRAEYDNPGDRRFHAEPNACPVCGPKLTLTDKEGRPLEADDPVQTAVDLLLSGHILAVKGLGGYHLSVDAGNDEAVKKLRSRKYREEKPLALMVRDMNHVRQIAHATPEEAALLTSPRRPIVLLKKKQSGLISERVAPSVPNLGILLPYTPLHHLLLENRFTALVMTSANQVDEPICTGNREAVSRLRGIADYFLTHNRDILVRCDDAIAFVTDGKSRLLRRSRGYVPQPIPLKNIYPPVLALGGQLKTAQCILKGRFAFLSPHIGDMETPQARDFFHESLALLKRMAETDPPVIAHDLHPAYYSTQAAREMPAERVVPVQHHHAHIVSCMAENRLEGEVIGLAMDGTGYGTDGTAWGGEFLIVSETAFKRFGHLQYLPLPGGEKAIREPWRICASLLKASYGASWHEIAQPLNMIPEQFSLELIDQIIDRKIHSPESSGLGRLFDGISALFGLRRNASFEGQAAMDLEALAAGETGVPYPFDILRKNDKPYILDPSAMIRAMVSDLQAGKNKASMAAAFHITLCEMFDAMAKEMQKTTGLTRVVLSGGCFQNRLLLEGAGKKLRQSGFEVYVHSQVPANDGGLALGQAVIAASMLQKGR